MKAQELHIGTVRQYRCAQTRINHMSEDAVKEGRTDNYDEFIKVDIDACDEAKFKCPRNTSNSKSLEGNWRPQLHLHGSLVWGVPSLKVLKIHILHIIIVAFLPNKNDTVYIVTGA